MAEVKPVLKAKLFFAIMYEDKITFDIVLNKLIKKFGQIDDFIEYDFNFTKYYESETGKDLKKVLVVFKKYVKKEILPTLKLYSNNLEKKYSINNKRKVNIDPGYLTLNSLVLASAKELPHRVYLSKGIYADIIMIFLNKKYVAQERAFSDLKQDIVIKFMEKTRFKIKNEQKII